MGSSESKSSGSSSSSSSSNAANKRARSYLEEMEVPTNDEVVQLFQYPGGVDLLHSKRGAWRPDCLNRKSSLFFRSSTKELASELAQLQDDILTKKLDVRELHALGAMVGLVVGDALGAPLEFRAVSYDANAQPRLTSMNDDAVWKTAGCNKFGLLPGQWTDDASMSLCLAESLLEHGRLHERDLRLRFLLWWQLGYCNAFGHDQQRLHGGSVGLGGNIGSSFEEFKDRRTRFTTAGNRATSGNGSLMRLAPAAVFFARAPPDETPAQRQQRYDAAMRLAYLQSKTTHQGDEAAECCRLLTYVLLTAIDDAAATPDDSGATRAQRVLGALPGTFRSPLHSVTALANSARETACRENRHLDLADRDWRWRARQYRYCEKRARSQPGYVGSYCMDALAMALHCAWHNATLPAAMLHCANLRGDADTTTAITAQLVGALHGIEAIPAAWLARVAEWDPHGLLFVRAHRLYQREHVANAASDDDNDDEEEPVTRDRNAEVDSDDETPNGAADGGDGGGDDDTDDDNDDVDNDDDNDTDNGTCNGNADDDEDSEATLELAQSAAVLTDDGPGFAVEPRECVHVEAISVTYDAVHALSSTLNANQCSEAECKGCTSENWLCVGCLQLFCGRYHNAHAKAHFSAKPTCGAVAIGYADLSCWCYECGQYAKHRALTPALRAMADVKFNE